MIAGGKRVSSLFIAKLDMQLDDLKSHCDHDLLKKIHVIKALYLKAS